MASVATAAETVAARSGAADGRLFRVKHLLILREQIAPFHAEFAVKETSLDFSRVRSAAAAILAGKNNGAILEFLLEGALPEIREYCRCFNNVKQPIHAHFNINIPFETKRFSCRDSRKEVDRQLKSVCESFIAASVREVVGPLQEFLKKVEEHRKDNKYGNRLTCLNVLVLGLCSLQFC
jgi:hypothetical protein